MSDSLESLSRRKESAAELGTVVRTMKAMAASNIGQYEMAVSALQDYYKTISLGIFAVFLNHQQQIDIAQRYFKQVDGAPVTAIVFGSDQGLVGRFNETLAAYVKEVLDPLPGEKTVWVVGDRIVPVLLDAGYEATNVLGVPSAIGGISPLISQISLQIGQGWDEGKIHSLYLFHNVPQQTSNYQPAHSQLLPLGINWRTEFTTTTWPGKLRPEVIGDTQRALWSLVNEYLFVSIYKASAESLASENASRLVAMQRAEKNIAEMLEELNQTYNRLRQSSIDEELFDVMAGFEALQSNR